MTQKELLYVEDAISHEDNMISIVNDITSNMQDKSLISFLKKEVKKHQMLKDKLVSKLKEKSHEW